MADQQDRPERDVEPEDPRSKEVGDGGYPEEQPAGAGGRGSAGERQGPEADEAAGEGAERAPSTSSASESEPGAASGNPDNAGGG